MSTAYSKHYSTRSKQNESVSTPIVGRENDMVKNNAGGFVFPVTIWTQLDRFLILGSEGGSFYVTEQKLTKENAKAVEQCLKEDGLRAVKRIVEISKSGRAFKNDPALFALAMASASDNKDVAREALLALPEVARIGTHLFHYVEFVENFRGWGRALRNSVANWYNDKPLDYLAEQLVKYQGRDGWTHSDVLRLSHPNPETTDRSTLYKWVRYGYNAISSENKAMLPAMVHAFEELKHVDNVNAVVKLITDHKLPREAIPTEWLNHKEVWDAMLPHMKMTALIRNLGVMSKNGVLTPRSDAERHVREMLSSEEKLKKARVHPISLLIALKTYNQGRGFRGTNTWDVNQNIVNSLDSAFYMAFANVDPTNKNHMIAVDVSGSMSSSCMNTPVISNAEAAAAIALVTMAKEPYTEVFGFSHQFKRLPITPRMRLDQVLQVTRDNNFGSTDASLPMRWATENRVNDFDAFVVITDNETWHGKHPTNELKKYRQQSGRMAKLAVLGTSTSAFSIADPADAGQMDLVGFDANVPLVLADFVR